MRIGHTDMPYTGKFLYNKKSGEYRCQECGNLLFDSTTKFDSGSGWPSFNSPADLKSVKLSEDRSFGMRRTSVSCAKCGSHLGHVFEDAPDQPTGMRYCVNSSALDFEERPEKEAKG